MKTNTQDCNELLTIYIQQDGSDEIAESKVYIAYDNNGEKDGCCKAYECCCNDGNEASCSSCCVDAGIGSCCCGC